MYSRILVPLDGSDTAEQVLPLARLLSRRLQARIELLRAVEYLPPEWMDWAIGSPPLEIAAAMSRHAEEYLSEVAQRLDREGVAVDTNIVGGRDAESIVEEAEKDPATLIAMCTHGRSGVTRWLLGSVTDRVLQATTRPVLIVRAPEGEADQADTAPETVIVPLDGSPLAEQVLPHVTSLAQALRLRVILVRVSLPVEDYYQSQSHPAGTELLPDLQSLAQDYLGRVQEELARQGVTETQAKALHGHAAQALIEFAEENPGALLAMTTHGRSGVGRWALGSVTDRVTRHSEVPVLVVRAAE